MSLTSFLSFRFVSMTTVATFCSHIILQKSAAVSSFGPVRQSSYYGNTWFIRAWITKVWTFTRCLYVQVHHVLPCAAMNLFFSVKPCKNESGLITILIKRISRTTNWCCNENVFSCCIKIKEKKFNFSSNHEKSKSALPCKLTYRKQLVEIMTSQWAVYQLTT